MDETGFGQKSEEEEETRRKTNDNEKEKRIEKIMRRGGRGKGGR